MLSFMSFLIYLVTHLYCILLNYWCMMDWKLKKQAANENKGKQALPYGNSSQSLASK